MSSYQDRQDLRLAPDLIQLAPIEAKAFLGLKAASERKTGAIPDKYRELMSVAVALTTQCGYCIDAHTKNAVAAGRSAEQKRENACALVP